VAGTLRRLVPEVEEVDLDDRARLLELYAPPEPEWLRLNLVASISGSAVGSDGTSETLTSRADRRLLGVIRELADVVLVGANSVRAEGYQLPRRSRLAIVTRSGDLGGHRLGEGQDGRPAEVLVLGPEPARARAAASIDARFIALPDDSMATLAAALRAEGFVSIVCEGGPSLAAQLIAADLVDEVCLTTSPRVNGGALPVLGTGAAPDRAATLTQLLLDAADGTLFARWKLSPPDARAAAHRATT
jgi:riboflavin biosynthesis pyrimidine reductase